jgi:hypothetical protein
VCEIGAVPVVKCRGEGGTSRYGEGSCKPRRDSIDEGRFRVGYDNTVRDNIRVYFNGLLQADGDDFTHGFLDLDDDDLKRNYLNFTEGFADSYFPTFDLRLGKQIITWGKAGAVCWSRSPGRSS